eukprot:1121972-Alexandrium_andersonii.AAC.1
MPRHGRPTRLTCSSRFRGSRRGKFACGPRRARPVKLGQRSCWPSSLIGRLRSPSSGALKSYGQAVSRAWTGATLWTSP